MASFAGYEEKLSSTTAMSFSWGNTSSGCRSGRSANSLQSTVDSQKGESWSPGRRCWAIVDGPAPDLGPARHGGRASRSAARGKDLPLPKSARHRNTSIAVFPAYAGCCSTRKVFSTACAGAASCSRRERGRPSQAEEFLPTWTRILVTTRPTSGRASLSASYSTGRASKTIWHPEVHRGFAAEPSGP